MQNIWSGFYRKTIEERLELLNNHNIISSKYLADLKNCNTLNVHTANNMVENVLSIFALPFSIVPNFIVNNINYTIPMVTEEPSVIAACSNAAKIIGKNGGFQTKIIERKMIGQVALYDIDDFEIAKKQIYENKNNIITMANSAHPSIVNRGGGACDIFVNTVTENNVSFLVVYLIVDVLEAMGANIINTMLEAIKILLETITSGKALMAILSNYATKSLVETTCKISISSLEEDLKTSYDIAKKIELASIFAKADIYRAATHNKGIFNGIDSLVIASGNDWRAIEAAGHSYAAKDGKYQGLSSWSIDKNTNYLIGTLTLPLPIASVGGSIGINPTVKAAHSLLNNPDAKTLAGVIASVGLAQNFSAIKALVSDGIQKGHMKLHAKSLAILAGASSDKVDLVTEKLLQEEFINLSTAKKIITTL